MAGKISDKTETDLGSHNLDRLRKRATRSGPAENQTHKTQESRRHRGTRGTKTEAEAREPQRGGREEGVAGVRTMAKRGGKVGARSSSNV